MSLVITPQTCTSRRREDNAISGGKYVGIVDSEKKKKYRLIVIVLRDFMNTTWWPCSTTNPKTL